MLPSQSDSAESLRVRLSESNFLHEAWVLRDGHGRRGYIRLNATSYPQPRRVRWSKEIISEHVDSSGDRVVGCVAYPHYYQRSPHDQTCHIMPAAVEQLVAWAAAASGDDPERFDGCLVFDEAHRAKNLHKGGDGPNAAKGSKTADAVLAIQKTLPYARVLYVSATAAAETKDLGYMVRLGLWGKGLPFSGK